MRDYQDPVISNNLRQLRPTLPEIKNQGENFALEAAVSDYTEIKSKVARLNSWFGVHMFSLLWSPGREAMVAIKHASFSGRLSFEELVEAVKPYVPESCLRQRIPVTQRLSGAARRRVAED